MADYELIFEGPDRVLNVAQTIVIGQSPVNYKAHVQLDLKLIVSEVQQGGTSTLTFTAEVHRDRMDWGAYEACYLDGDIVWRRKGETTWNVVGMTAGRGGTFSAFSGNAVASLNSDAAGQGYVPVNNAGSGGGRWTETVSGVSASILEVGIRQRKSNGGNPNNAPSANFSILTVPGLLTINNECVWSQPYCFPPGDTEGAGYSDFVWYQEISLGPVGAVHIDLGGNQGFQPCTVWVDTGTEWIQAIPYVDSGGTTQGENGWLPCG